VLYLTDVFSAEAVNNRMSISAHRLSLTDVLLTPIERPRCGRCETRMMLAQITPQSDRTEKRIFECPKCSFIETRVVTDPLKSESINRLTANIRPPA
jgi:hypothetical protein